ncbi:MAG: NADH-quinone oxidoreductase subunit NuoB [Anaerolineales bacterium]|nr:NADH-quinone oxidoreductase subunit NuoB [Anaerolineales bacterium]
MENEKLSLPNYNIPEDLENVVAVTTLDRLYNWGRRSSVWPLMFGLACCAIEMIAAQTARYDMARFGMEVMRPTPRQADMMLVSGTVTKKMLPAIIRLYNQMPEPKYVVAMGACASSGGPFKEGYNVVAGIDKFLPVYVYIPGRMHVPATLALSSTKKTLWMWQPPSAMNLVLTCLPPSPVWITSPRTKWKWSITPTKQQAGPVWCSGFKWSAWTLLKFRHSSTSGRVLIFRSVKLGIYWESNSPVIPTCAAF